MFDLTTFILLVSLLAGIWGILLIAAMEVWFE